MGFSLATPARSSSREAAKVDLARVQQVRASFVR
jgi:hypothetical protein